MLQDRGDAAAVLALQAVDRRQPRLDHVEPARLGIEVLGVAAQFAGEVADLDGDRLEPLDEPVELRVDAGHALERRTGRRQHGRRPALAVGGLDRLDPAHRRAAERRHVAQPVAQQLALLLLVR